MPCDIMAHRTAARYSISRRGWIKITIKAVVLSAIFAILTVSSQINFIKLPSTFGLYNFFTSITFLYDFIVMILVMIFYDVITSRRLWMYENLFSLLIILLAFSMIQLNLFKIVALTIVSIIIGSVIGGVIRYYSIKAGVKSEISGALFFIIAALLLLTLSLHSNLIVSPSIPSNINEPYLTQSQLNSTFGYGTYSENPLSVSGTGIGGSLYVFPTPIKELLLYNVSLADVEANGGYLVTFYSFTFVNSSKIIYANLTQQVWNTPQAGLLMQDYELSLSKVPNTTVKIGSLNGFNYVALTSIGNNSTPNFLIVGQNNNYITFISCYGLLCRENEMNSLLQDM
jgi:hypothetical protein